MLYKSETTSYLTMLNVLKGFTSRYKTNQGFPENSVFVRFICADNKYKIKTWKFRSRFFDTGVSKTTCFPLNSHDLLRKAIGEAQQANVYVLLKKKNEPRIF